MNFRILRGFARMFLFSTLAAAAFGADASPAPTIAKPTAAAPVTITDNGTAWTLDNGIVRATVAKRSGQMSNLIFYGTPATGNATLRGGGNWEEDPSAAAQVGGLTDAVTIDPATNGGERAEVAVKGVTGGKIGLSPNSPGQGADGTVNIDLELRVCLGRGESGIYTYAIFSHPAEYGAANIGESRFILGLNREFDWISVDKDRNMLECAPTDWGTGVVVNAKEQRIMSQGVYENSVEHKYSYTAVQYTTPAYGWSSTKNHVGIWFINPTIEYLSGGATKQELDCHFGDNGNPPPIILDYWRGTHYGGGAQCSVAAGEEWHKVIGPIFVYVNALDNFKTPSQTDLDTLAASIGDPTVPAAWKDNATALWQDALTQAKTERAKWPYAWVNGVDFPHKDQRGSVSGQLVLNDPLAPAGSSKLLPHLTVGLAHPDYANGPRTIDWVHDAKFYQFWNDGGADGKFSITDVRPGNYTLHAFADGVLGEFAQANITVEAGKNINLGQLKWSPVRYGAQVWDIGYPDRTGGKFFKGDGDNYWLWGWNLRYALLYPNDLTYTVGKSDYHKDWFFEEVPHATADPATFVNPAAKDPANQRFGWVRAYSLDEYPQTVNGNPNSPGPWRIFGQGRATTWTVKFNMDKSVQGYAALRVALAGADTVTTLAVAVNGQGVGAIGDNSNANNARIVATNAIRYNTDKGIWQERTLTFDASVLKPGENTMTFTVPAGNLQSGVVWDYLRLELNQDYKLDGTKLTPPKT
ncbi:MAG TPA: polysaccharide lyase family protein [Opitutales bacterium]|jgi:rhamnogalacturonan endolyase|nr:polysaccharide lyase family protein [Opitutales bacterium]